MKDVRELAGVFRELEKLCAGRDYEVAAPLTKKIDAFIKPGESTVFTLRLAIAGSSCSRSAL